MSTVVMQSRKGETNASLINRYLILLTSIGCYAIGVAGLVALILGFSGILPLGQLFVMTDNVVLASILNVVLLLLFGLQHSIMARQSFKVWSAKFIHPALERSMFTLASGLVSLIAVVFWQPIEGSLWQLSGIGLVVMWAIFLAGWGYLLAATFAINHFDLFGLRQAWFGFKNQPYKAVPFKENWMYRYSRHPIMLGALIGMWCVPQMNGAILFMSVGLTLYIVVGLYFEERDLIRQWGRQYEEYRKRVGALITLPKSSK